MNLRIESSRSPGVLFGIVFAVALTVSSPAGWAADAHAEVSSQNASARPTTKAGPTAPPRRPYSITEERAPCADYTPTRRAFFGDTHVHTTHSQDASTQDTRTRPRDAYRFAKGDPLGIQPFDADGRSMRTVKLDRPLDFTVVTDHAEQIGEVHICKTPGVAGHDSMICRLYRSFPRVAFFVMNGQYSMRQKRWGFCGEDNELCFAAARTIWQDHRDAAEEAYDRSPGCSFTSFVGYEWTSIGGKGVGSGHLHRNVVFRNEKVPDLPISVMETGKSALNLWQRLEEECVSGKPGCEAITIPHNSNWGAESTFTSADEAALFDEITQREAPLRAKYDRLVEIMQHKGESECALVPGVTDEGCGFEKVHNVSRIELVEGPPEFRAVNFARDALKRGLGLERALGVNPLRFGVIGSTDTHLGTPGLVRESNFSGHGGAGKPNRDEIAPGLPEFIGLNPGGLAVIWAEENSRDALFAGMRRREAYATSGTRPELRLFGGWDFAADDCTAEDLAARGYERGVPMGGELRPRPTPQSQPTLLVAATRDPDPALAGLERIEIVKGWLEDGEAREKVITVAGGDRRTSVDLDTCERKGEAHAQLCTVFVDPDFDPSERAFYYARVREAESCRWSQYACNAGGVDCADPSTVTEGFEACCAEDHARTIQERAWSSPIWYRPTESAAR